MAQLPDSTTTLDDVAPFRVFRQDILKTSLLIIRQKIDQQAGECWGLDEFHCLAFYTPMADGATAKN